MSLPGPPPRPSKYQPLADYLATQEGNAVRLSVADIELILGFPLPVSAYVDSHWWRTVDFPQVRVWTVLGWQAQLTPRSLVVVFTRITAARGAGA